MNSKSLMNQTAKSGEQLTEEKPVLWKEENYFYPVEEQTNENDKEGKPHKLAYNYSSDDNCYEDNWLEDEENLNFQDISGSSRETGTFVYKKVLELKNLNFQDKDVPKADMLVCSLCNSVFINELTFKNHRFQVHRGKKKGRPKKEEQLNQRKEYPKENWTPDVQRLVKRVGNSKVFVCDLCPYTVKRCDSMVKHVIRVHSKGLVKPQYMCEVCGKTFVDRAYFRNHGLSHNRDKQYSCEICGQRFHRQPSLKRHILCHSGEKQFSCSLCDYKTNRKHLMYNHSENHRARKAHICKYCHDEFYTQLSLRRHRYLHHPSRHSCSSCKICFSSKERLSSHKQKIHSICEIKDHITENSATQTATDVEFIDVNLETKSIC